MTLAITLNDPRIIGKPLTPDQFMQNWEVIVAPLEAHVNETDPAAAHKATSVVYSPSGEMTAVTIQGAIDELSQEKVSHSLTTALNDMLVGDGAGKFIKKTLAEMLTILGINYATQTQSGVVVLATNDETTAGTNQNKVVSPSSLKFVLDSRDSELNAALAAHAALTAAHGMGGLATAKPGAVSSSTSGVVGASTKMARGDHSHDLGSHGHTGATDGGQISHSSLTNAGTNTHAQIDSHIANATNPHGISSVSDVNDAAAKRHTQNTDTGTNSATFQVGASGPKLKNNAGVVETRNSSDSDYADLVVKNLTVKGTTMTVNAETVNIDDNVVVLNSNYAGNTPTENAGIAVNRGTQTKVQFIWDESADKFKAGFEGSEDEVILGSAPQTLTNKTISNSTFSGNISGNADTATKLATARTIAISGDAIGSVSFDGSTDKTFKLFLANSGVTAGTYTKVTTDAKGRITGGANPTTLSGYGITDAVKNAGGCPSIQEGIEADRPLAGTAGRLYVATDTNTLYRDNGSSWKVIASGEGCDTWLTSAKATVANAVDMIRPRWKLLSTDTVSVEPYQQYVVRGGLLDIAGLMSLSADAQLIVEVN